MGLAYPASSEDSSLGAQFLDLSLPPWAPCWSLRWSPQLQELRFQFLWLPSLLNHCPVCQTSMTSPPLLLLYCYLMSSQVHPLLWILPMYNDPAYYFAPFLLPLLPLLLHPLPPPLHPCFPEQSTEWPKKFFEIHFLSLLISRHLGTRSPFQTRITELWSPRNMMMYVHMHHYGVWISHRLSVATTGETEQNETKDSGEGGKERQPTWLHCGDSCREIVGLLPVITSPASAASALLLTPPPVTPMVVPKSLMAGSSTFTGVPGDRSSFISHFLSFDIKVEECLLERRRRRHGVHTSRLDFFCKSFKLFENPSCTTSKYLERKHDRF